VIIAFGCEGDRALMDSSLKLFPPNVHVLRIELPAGYAMGELVGVLYAMLIVEAVSRGRHQDVGQPNVPEFGRALYGTDVRSTMVMAPKSVPAILVHKVPQLDAAQMEPWISAATSFLAQIEHARFKGIVCDFDGTCCYTPRRWDGLDDRLVPEMNRLLASGIELAFATGRGDSIQTALRSKLPAQYWSRVLVGYFSGSSIHGLDAQFTEPAPDARFAALRLWLAEHCLTPKSPTDLKVCGGQMSVRLTGEVSKEAAVSAISYWIAENGLQGWRVFCSGHSVDVLAQSVGKKRVVAHLSKALGVDPETEILRIGDSGHFGGNDFELLSEGLGLSVATASPLKVSCWNLLPATLHGAAGMQHYLSSLHVDNGRAQFSEEFVDGVRKMLSNTKGLG
jgi:hypothetical protein